MKLKEHIKHYRQFRQACPASGGWSYDDADCTNAICDAYIAEHPEDDSEPLTVDWISLQGFHQGETRVGIFWWKQVKGGFVVECEFVEQACELRLSASIFVSATISSQATRGDLRKLLRGLGVNDAA